MCKETWKEIEGFNGIYKISTLGAIKSLWKKCQRDWEVGSEYTDMELNYNEGGETVLLTNKDGKKILRSVAALVLETFVGKSDKGKFAIKKDGNPTNNRLENLSWGTEKERVEISRKNGTMIVGEDHKFAVLSNDEVAKLKTDLVYSDFNLKEIGEKFGVSWLYVRKILHNEKWKHIPWPDDDIKKVIEIECEYCSQLFEEERFKRGQKSRFCDSSCRRKARAKNKKKKHNENKKTYYREIIGGESE